jgi:hypothetical protein
VEAAGIGMTGSRRLFRESRFPPPPRNGRGSIPKAARQWPSTHLAGPVIQKLVYSDRADAGQTATRAEAIYVLHGFEKKTRKTSAHDLRIGRDRFRALVKLRQQHGKEKHS